MEQHVQLMRTRQIVDSIEQPTSQQMLTFLQLFSPLIISKHQEPYSSWSYDERRHKLMRTCTKVLMST